MLIQIYQSMVDLAAIRTIPTFIEHQFFINKEQSQKFWSNNKESEILLDEWDSPEKGIYKKKFLGCNFTIRFEQYQ